MEQSYPECGAMHKAGGSEATENASAKRKVRVTLMLGCFYKFMIIVITHVIKFIYYCRSTSSVVHLLWWS